MFEDLLKEIDEIDELNKSIGADAGDEGESGGESSLAKAKCSADMMKDMSDMSDEDFAGKYSRKKNRKGDDGEYMDGEGDYDEEPMGKSFSVTLDDGTVVEAMDGSELVKALSDRFDANSQDVEKALTAVVGQLKTSTELLKSLTEQNTGLQEELKVLKSDFAGFAKGGTGRKSAINIHEKPASTIPAKEEQVDGQEILNKALVAQKNGKLQALDVARVESYINRGIAVPEQILNVIEAA